LSAHNEPAARSGPPTLKEKLKAWGDRGWELYDRAVLLNPKKSLAALALVVGIISIGIKDFRVDASGDTLVLEHDEDVRYYRSLTDRYGSGDFVVITYSPKAELFSKESLDKLRKIREELKTLKRVTSVVTILDVPLLKNPPGTLKELKNNMKTLEDPKASIPYAVAEFKNSPIYQNLLVGENMKSSAIQVNFKVEQSDLELVNRRTELREKEYRKEITPAESQELEGLEARHRAYKDAVVARRHEDLAAIRKIIAAYSSEDRFFLGGIPMIVEDISAYIRSDMAVFGCAMMLFVIVTLYLIYRHVRWVALPLISCLIALLVMMGGMGFAHWDATVVSSNFISLQIILTMSFAIHIVSHYRELVWFRPKLNNHELCLATARESFVPMLYTNLAVIAGFDSLIFCDIKPVVQFGWIMTLGMIVSLVVVYWFLPAAIVMLPKLQAEEEDEWGAPITFFFARVADQHRGWVYAASLVVALFTVAGVANLQVENSFINYFRKHTEIYQGMKFIDQELGGTTPLDIILTLKDEKKQAAPSAAASSDSDFAEFGEFEEKAKDASNYWFTTSRISTIEKVHDYLESLPQTGKTLSLATLNKTAKDLNGGKAFDDLTLSLLYNAASETSKKILVNPYVVIERDEARVTTRIRDSLPNLHRDALIKQIRRELVEKVGLKPDQFRVSGLMLLYNNMLQSLYTSQIKTLGSSMFALFVMFMLLFRDVKIAIVGLIPQGLACMSILGIMGLGQIPLDVMTITVVSIAVGIGVEDAIYYIYRFQEEFEKDQDYVRSMYATSLTIGNATFYTSVAVIAGFGILSISNFIPTALFGVLTGSAMVIACISAQTLLPALIVLTKPFGPQRKSPPLSRLVAPN
jgi:uncharacterized protein